MAHYVMVPAWHSGHPTSSRQQHDVDVTPYQHKQWGTSPSWIMFKSTPSRVDRVKVGLLPSHHGNVTFCHTTSPSVRRRTLSSPRTTSLHHPKSSPPVADTQINGTCHFTPDMHPKSSCPIPLRLPANLKSFIGAARRHRNGSQKLDSRPFLLKRRQISVQVQAKSKNHNT